MSDRPRAIWLTVLLTAAALVGFAGNSLLCRLALAEHQIDASGFTVVRLASGAAVLALVGMARRAPVRAAGNWASAAALFLYAAPFSFAYLRIGAGLGALVLFGSVQVTMIGWGVIRGERPSAQVWLGFLIALGGLFALTAPGKSAPDPTGVAMMAFAGVMWGVYSLRGRANPESALVTTAGNFIRSLPLAIGLGVAALLNAGGPAGGLTTTLTWKGLGLAVASGAIASGLGYSLWYAALRGLSATNAGVVQLLVPVLATAGGVALLGESLIPRVTVSGVAILAGVGMAILGRRRGVGKAAPNVTAAGGVATGSVGGPPAAAAGKGAGAASSAPAVAAAPAPKSNAPGATAAPLPRPSSGSGPSQGGPSSGVTGGGTSGGERSNTDRPGAAGSGPSSKNR